jgi:hypothetical protein
VLGSSALSRYAAIARTAIRRWCRSLRRVAQHCTGGQGGSRDPDRVDDGGRPGTARDRADSFPCCPQLEPVERRGRYAASVSHGDSEMVAPPPRR